MDIKYLKGVGEKRAEAFSKIGINTLDDFLNFIPRAYIHKINIREINNHIDENVIVTGEVIDVVYPRKSNHPLQIILKDKTGVLDIPVFGTSEFRAKQFRLNEKFLFWIKVDKDNFSSTAKISYRDHLKLNEFDLMEKDFLKFSFFPVYELSGILKKTWIKPMLLSKIIFNAFSTLLKSNPNANSIYPSRSGTPLVTGNKLRNGLNENLIQYDIRNAESIANVSKNIVSNGNSISIFEDLLFNC